MNKTAVVVRCFFTTDLYVPTKANAFAVRIVFCVFLQKNKPLFAACNVLYFQVVRSRLVLLRKNFDLLRFQVNFLNKRLFCIGNLPASTDLRKHTVVNFL